MRAAALALLTLLASPALGADTTPFARKAMSPYFLEVGTEARQYPIDVPAGSTSYRMVNPCYVDIRILTVDSATEKVTHRTGTRYLARTVEVMATMKPTFVSVIAESPPEGTCTIEMQYGTGQ